jgi:RND family efflux transporter MFP subunit
MTVLLALCLIPSALLIACSGASDDAAANAAAGPSVVQVGPENVIMASRGTIVVGPNISGELRAEREATVRAELGGSMIQVAVEQGQAVRKGQLLGRIEAQTLGDVRQSALSAVRSAENQLAVTQREAERAQQLVTAGALAARDLDVARNNVTTAEAQLADARSRLVNAEKQLSDAVLRAPLTGIVSRRPVNAGDVVTVGTELFTVIDPSSMRLEASVPSDSISALRIGATVDFEVRGYDQKFQGVIQRIAPEADATTRQIPIFVSIPNPGGRLVSGLFAEGRVVVESLAGIVVPAGVVSNSGDKPWVLRVTGGKAERVDVTVGLRDDRTERVAITAGLNEGDQLLRGAAQGIAPGTPVQVSGAK